MHPHTIPHAYSLATALGCQHPLVEASVVGTPLPRRRLILNILEDAQLLRQFKNGGCGFDFLSRHRQLGRVSILRECLERAAWLSVYGSGEQRRLAAEFVSYIPQRAEGAGKEVYEKATKIVEEGMSRSRQVWKAQRGHGTRHG
jgi:hypothetical protein